MLLLRFLKQKCISTPAFQCAAAQLAPSRQLHARPPSAWPQSGTAGPQQLHDGDVALCQGLLHAAGLQLQLVRHRAGAVWPVGSVQWYKLKNECAGMDGWYRLSDGTDV